MQNNQNNIAKAIYQMIIWEQESAENGQIADLYKNIDTDFLKKEYSCIIYVSAINALEICYGDLNKGSEIAMLVQSLFFHGLRDNGWCKNNECIQEYNRKIQEYFSLRQYVDNPSQYYIEREALFNKNLNTETGLVANMHFNTHLASLSVTMQKQIKTLDNI